LSRQPPHIPDPVTLAIDTAGSACSVAVACGGEITAESKPLRHGHAEALFPMIERVTAAAGVRAADLDIVAVTVGPGGFTGIRVGLAAAHGIALAAHAALAGVTVFEAVAVAANAARCAGSSPLLVALDSRRTELYVQLFAAEAAAIGDPAAIAPERLVDYVAAHIRDAALLVAGDAAPVAAAALGERPATSLLADSACDARAVIAAAEHRRRTGNPPQAARPFYLRPPDVTVPKRQERPSPDGPRAAGLL
jgi:tRNA threonylcarbamoyladenosine biosynthesis protein TsaB